MKRILTAVLALCLMLSLAACSSDDSEESASGSQANQTQGEGTEGASDILMPVWTAPQGYEEYDSNQLAAAYVKYDGNGEVTHEIDIVFFEAEELDVQGIQSKSQEELEDLWLMDFDDNLTLTFLERNGYDGMLIEDHENGQLVAVTYYFIIGDWMMGVMTGEGRPDTAEEIHPDLLEVIDSVYLKEFTFGG